LGFPEDLTVAEGAEPEQIDPVGKCGASGKENDCGDGEEDEEDATPWPGRL